MSKKDIDIVSDLVLNHRQQKNSQYSAATPQTPQPNSTSPQTQQPNNSHADSNDQTTQGDWGEMPVETVAIGLSRQLDPTKFSKNHPSLASKKKT
jgi:hypothetical protein